MSLAWKSPSSPRVSGGYEGLEPLRAEFARMAMVGSDIPRHGRTAEAEKPSSAPDVVPDAVQQGVVATNSRIGCLRDG